MKYRKLFAAAFVVFFFSQAGAQHEPDLDRLDEKLVRHLEPKMPGWSHERIRPIEGSKGVLIQRWSSTNRSIRIAISAARSPQEARQAMQNMMRDVKGQPLTGFGDDAFVWGFEGSDLEIRRGRFIIDLNAGADVGSDPDARALTPAQRHDRELAEVKRIIRGFAKHLVDAVDLP